MFVTLLSGRGVVHGIYCENYGGGLFVCNLHLVLNLSKPAFIDLLEN